MRVLVALFAVALSTACGAPPAANDTPPSAASALAVSSASPSASAASPVPPGFSTCVIAPMSLELRTPEGRAHELLRLEADGKLHVKGFGNSLEARVDAQGCVRGPDGLWVELTPSGNVWTPHALLRADATSLRMPEGVRHEFGSDGRVTRVEADGTRATGEYGSVWIPGYRAEAHCSAVLLYTAMLSMMPSMAVVDGVARREPAPSDARCAATTPSDPAPAAGAPSASPRAPR